MRDIGLNMGPFGLSINRNGVVGINNRYMYDVLLYCTIDCTKAMVYGVPDHGGCHIGPGNSLRELPQSQPAAAACDTVVPSCLTVNASC